jgi:hypothetical protein
MKFKITVLLLIFIGCDSVDNKPIWFKGNLHTHTLWSDGDAPPETVVNWYRQNGYKFLALSDHNILSEGEKWIDVLDSADTDAWPPPFTMKKLEKLKHEFGDDWPVLRYKNDTLQMRLKTLSELRNKFEKPGEFLLIQAEEITDEFENYPVHLNATNLESFIPPQGGKSIYNVLQRNVDAVIKQREESNRSMFAHVNHPNFGWGIVAEDLMKLKGDPFFEVYNGHPGVRNMGDDTHPGTERMWDLILTNRIHNNMGIFYGLATDDAHSYYNINVGKSNAGRGWVMVNAKSFNSEDLTNSLMNGNFYSSAGVILENIEITENHVKIFIRPESDVTYTTLFFGTAINTDTSSIPILDDENQLMHTTRKYSKDIGQVIDETRDNPAIYKFKGDELYIRAKIISSRKHPNPYAEGDFEMAWTQPILLYTKN